MDSILARIPALDRLLTDYPLLSTALDVAFVLLASWLAYLVTSRFVLRAIGRIVERTQSKWDDALQEQRVFERLAYLAPAVVVFYGAQFFVAANNPLQVTIQRFATAMMVAVIVAAADAFLNAANAIYTRFEVSKARPIKGYLQVAKIVLYVFGAIVVVSLLVNKSPLLFLSGIGALTAVLLLIFKDTILSLVASIQIASNDMVRVGDWIEMPQLRADGDVIDVALHTVKVQNWDKTITTIPTYKLISDSFKNWRGMSESGGRRIKRSINVDIQTIRFLTEDELDRFEKFAVLRDYIRGKRAELAAANSGGDSGVVVNSRNLTNIGTFRAYVAGYLRSHPKIHEGMTFLIRQLAPTEKGLPLEIYVFSNDIAWVAYEGIQSDIFDHLLAAVPEFGLRVFQHPSGADFRAALGGRQEDG
jgi:miniconductance mechanosensitive channel